QFLAGRGKLSGPFRATVLFLLLARGRARLAVPAPRVVGNAGAGIRHRLLLGQRDQVDLAVLLRVAGPRVRARRERRDQAGAEASGAGDLRAERTRQRVARVRLAARAVRGLDRRRFARDAGGIGVPVPAVAGVLGIADLREVAVRRVPEETVVLQPVRGDLVTPVVEVALGRPVGGHRLDASAAVRDRRRVPDVGEWD